MQVPQVRLVNAMKVILAVAALAALATLAGVAGSQLAPNLPLGKVLLFCAAGAVLLIGVLVLAAVATATFGQFILRKGGTDTQWFWFASEPPGLLKIRKQIAAEAKAGAR